MADVYLDEKFVGTVADGKEFAKSVVLERRKGKLSPALNVRYAAEFDEVYLETSKGRLRRPLIVVSDGVSLLTEKHILQLQKNELSWDDLVAQGVIEYLDAAEEENAYVAFSPEELTKEHTHLEIDPLVMMGAIASLVPYGNYSQSTRITIGAKNQKQSIGFYAQNFSLRVDMDVNLLHTPQYPIVKTIMYDILNFKKHASGQNIVVAVMSFEGYNMEDAVILNRQSIDYGFGRSSYYRQAIAEEIRYSGGLMDTICIPDKEVKGYRSEKDYRYLEEDGIIYPEAVVKEDDVLIGKTSPPRFLSSSEDYSFAVNQRRESSVALSHGEKGVVDMVMLTESEEGNRVVQVRLRDQRIPEIGDKFTSRHGQKGIVGLVVPPADMPFTASGIVPDMLFSPHSIPSRMTVSHLLELIGGKVGSLSGRFVDGTTFSSEKETDLRNELRELGFRYDGTEVMYNGITGKPMQARIYIGNMYYLKLKHMVANKLHARARGPIQLLTRQPTEGRAKEGGLRLGEMEKDTFVASGSALLLKERFDSDKVLVHVCEQCGLLAIKDDFRNRVYCSVCGENAPTGVIEISYAFKLLLDELKALCIYPKLKLVNKY
ncbi:MAG: DNA-directed RNA polymerase subunit B [Candidatus Woesearchaeota archaeon]